MYCKNIFKKVHLPRPNGATKFFKKCNIYVKQFLLLGKNVLLPRLCADSFNILFNIINFFSKNIRNSCGVKIFFKLVLWFLSNILLTYLQKTTYQLLKQSFLVNALKTGATSTSCLIFENY